MFITWSHFCFKIMLIITTNGWNLQCMIKIVKLCSYCQHLDAICHCPWQSLNVFFSETARTVFTRFHIGPSVERMLTICSNGSAPLNKMAVMPMYGKILKISFSSTKKPLRLNLGIQHQRLKVYLVCWNYDTVDLFMVWSNLCPCCCGNTGRNCMAFADIQKLFYQVSISRSMGLFYFSIMKTT